MKKTLLYILLLLSVATSGSAQHAGASLYKMSRLVRLASIEARKGQGQYAKTLTGGRERGDSRAFDVPGQRSLCAFVQMKGDGRRVLEENHCTPLAQFGDIYIADIPLRHLDGLSLSESVLRIEAGRSHTLTMDTTAVIVDAPAVWNGSSLPQAYTGQGVVVGVMDVGFDVTNPNFYDTTLTATRIRRFWDQLSPDSIGSGMYVGADYRTPEEILAYAHSHDGLIETHGTHTLGIAAGTGFDTPYRGMAYDADICIVSNAVNTDLPLIPEELLYKYTSATDVLGFKYIFDYAQEVGKPCVISFSEGSSQSFDDDERLFEEVLGQIQGPGRILVASAGNDGSRRTYQHKPRGVERDGVFFLSQSDHTYFCMASENQFQICLSAYTSATDREQLYIPTADILNAEDSTVVDSVDFFGHRLKYTIQACRAYFNPDLIAYYLLAEMQGGVGWSLFLSAEAVGEEAAVDFYSSATQFYPSEINPSISGGEPAYSVGSPGCAPSVICVGATAYRDHIVNADGVAQTYDCGHDGEVADYSSVGPTRDGRIKPDVVANGTHVVSSASSYFIEANPEGSVKDYTVATSRFHDRTYPWAAFLGTSMSTPVVAGTIALWLQANPDLTTRQVMDVLAATSHRRDGARQGEKNNRWGYGEIDAYAGLLRVLGLDGISEISNHHPSRLDIKYADDTVWLSAEGEVPAERVSVAIYSVAGKRMLQKSVCLSSDPSGISLSSLPSGVYVVQTTSVTPGFTGSCVFRK